MGKLEKLIKNIPPQRKRITPQTVWAGLLHLYCSAMISMGAYNVVVTTENLLNPTEIKYIDLAKLKEEVNKSVEIWKDKTYSFKDYYENKKVPPYTFKDYLENKKE